MVVPESTIVTPPLKAELDEADVCLIVLPVESVNWIPLRSTL